MRKLLRYVVVSGVLGTVFFLGICTYRLYQNREENKRRIQTLQHYIFYSLDNKGIFIDELDQFKPIVIIYFHPECDYCKNELREFSLHANTFKHVNLVMVTPDDSIKRIERFVAENNLFEVDNLLVLRELSSNFSKCFGSSNIPSVFIYKGNKLIKSYIGETNIEAILSIIDSI